MPSFVSIIGRSVELDHDAATYGGLVVARLLVSPDDGDVELIHIVDDDKTIPSERLSHDDYGAILDACPDSDELCELAFSYLAEHGVRDER